MNAFILVIAAQLSGGAWGPVVDNMPFKTMAACQAHAEFVADQMVELSKTNSTIEFRKEKATDGGFFVRSDSRVAAILRCRPGKIHKPFLNGSHEFSGFFQLGNGPCGS